MASENIRIIWTDNETGEAKEVYNADVSLAQLFAINEAISNEQRKLTIPNYTETVDYFHEIEKFQKNIITRALIATNWNKKQAAKILCMNRPTLQEVIKRLNIQKPAQFHHLISPDNNLIKLQAVSITEDIISEQERAKTGLIY